MSRRILLNIRWVCLVAIALLSGVCCSSQPVAGSGGTGSETVIGTIVHRDGTPAAGTEVLLLPADYDPVSGGPAIVLRDTTDAAGRYTIRTTDRAVQVYSLQAVSSSGSTRAYVPEIALRTGDSATAVPDAALVATGSVQVYPDDSAGYGYVYMPGTLFYAEVNGGYAQLDSLPAQLLPLLVYTRGEGVVAQIDNIAVADGMVSVVTTAGSAVSAKVVINTKGMGLTAADTVFNFPLLLRCTSENFNFAQTRSDGTDLRLTKPDNTPLPFEVERWNTEARLGEVWVKVDTLHGNDSSVAMVLHWGEAATVLPTSPVKVFDTTEGFRGVWHLAEERSGVGDAGLYLDAAAGNSGDDFISDEGRDGIIGLGKRFDGIDDYILVQSPVTPFKRGDLTIALWVSMRDSGGTILSKLGTTDSWKLGDACFYFGDGTTIDSLPGANGLQPSFVWHTDSYAIAGETIGSDVWHHLALTWVWQHDSIGTFRYYIDGSEVALSVDSLYLRTLENMDAMLRIGYPNHNESYAFFNGAMDELRISSVARDAVWIQLSYQNQSGESAMVNLLYPTSQ